MQPIQIKNTTKRKIVQTAITLFLLLVLLSIVGLYIYYGMYLAKQNNTSELDGTANEGGITTTEQSEIEARLKVLQELIDSSPVSTSTVEERMKVLEELIASSTLPTDTNAQFAELEKLINMPPIETPTMPEIGALPQLPEIPVSSSTEGSLPYGTSTPGNPGPFTGGALLPIGTSTPN